MKITIDTGCKPVIDCYTKNQKEIIDTIDELYEENEALKAEIEKLKGGKA